MTVFLILLAVFGAMALAVGVIASASWLVLAGTAVMVVAAVMGALRVPARYRR